jgi:serine/threonine protein kinase
MLVLCLCGAENSAFTPRCVTCGRIVEEPAAPIMFASAARSFSPGQVVAGYVVGALLGAGGVGRVYRAEREGGGPPVALKVLHEHLAQSKELRSRFAREARALSLFTHRHIGRIIEVLDFDETAALVLEAYEGSNLREKIERRPPPPTVRLATWLRQLCEALGALHDRGWIHRDVKPENVFIAGSSDATAEVRLLDFGLVRELDGSSDSIRTAGAFVGSPAYASPEQLLGEETGPFTDWWALGVVTFEALTGRRPFAGSTRAAVATEVLTGTPPTMGIDPTLDAWVAALMTKDARARPQSLADVVEPLDRWLASAPSS